MEKRQKTQKTQQGEEIPIPKRKDVMRDLEKVANLKPKKSRIRRPKK